MYAKDKDNEGKGKGEISALVHVRNLYIFGVVQGRTVSRV